MQFDAAEGAGASMTNHDVIARFCKAVGYDMSEIVYWNPAGEPETALVEAECESVALVSGFSPTMMKVFIGEDVGETVDDDAAMMEEKGEEITNPESRDDATVDYESYA